MMTVPFDRCTCIIPGGLPAHTGSDLAWKRIVIVMTDYCERKAKNGRPIFSESTWGFNFEKPLSATLFVPSCYLWLVAFLSSPWQLERGSVCSAWKKRSKKYHIYIFCQSPSSSSSLSSSSLLMSSLSRCHDVSLHHSESLNFSFVVFCVLYRANSQEEILRCLFWKWK